MEIFVGVLVGLFMLMLLVTGHELGHFFMARRNGVEVEEFGICFPPRAIAWRKVNGKWQRLKRKEWDNPPGEGLILSLNWLPIGGFCQMKGEGAADKRPHSFGKASFWSKTKILFGGVAVNWLIAIVVFTVLALVGMPQYIDDQFVVESDKYVIVKKPVTLGDVINGSPADAAGLSSGDVMHGARVETCDDSGKCETESYQFLVAKDLMNFNDSHAGQTVYYSVTNEDGENDRLVEITLNSMEDDYRLGATLSSSALYRSSWSAPIVGVGTTLQITGETFKGIGKLLYDLVVGTVKRFMPSEEAREEGKAALAEAGDSVSGPVGIIGVLFPAFVQLGPDSLMFLVALISISLAVMNVLPIPALDGGRWFLIALYKLRKKELTKEVEEKIVGRAFAAIMILALIITVLDITKLIK